MAWQQVSLPHTASIEPVIKTAQQWQGICFYLKFFTLDKKDAGKYIAIHIDAAMNLADVYLNGKHLQTHTHTQAVTCLFISISAIRLCMVKKLPAYQIK